MTEELINLNRGDNYFGPDDELDAETIDNCRKEAEAELLDERGDNLEMNLEKDTLTIPGQEIAIVSFIGPYSILKVQHDVLQLCVRGSEESVEMTRRRILKMRDLDPRLDLFTFEMYCWIAVPPNPIFMKDNNAHEEHLNNLITKHRLDIKVSQKIFEARKSRLTHNPDLNKEDSDEQGEIEEETLVEEVKTEDSNEKTEEELEEILESAMNELKLKEISPEPKIQKFSDNEDLFDANEKLDKGTKSGNDYCVISTVGDYETAMAIKIKGFFATEQEANDHVKVIMDQDDTFETFVVSSFHWLPLNTKPQDLKNQVYQDEELNTLTQDHQKGQQEADSFSKMKENTSKASETSASEVLFETSRVIEDHRLSSSKPEINDISEMDELD